MSEKTLVYVAGSFRAKTPYLVEKNIRAAEYLSVAVANTSEGFPVCPHTMGRYLSGAAPDQVWLDGDLEMMRRCDAVLVCPGYEKSSGTLAEIAEAFQVGIPIYYAKEVSDRAEDLPMDLLSALGGVARL